MVPLALRARYVTGSWQTESENESTTTDSAFDEVVLRDR